MIEKKPKTSAGVRDLTIGDRFIEALHMERERYLCDKEEYGYEFKDLDYVVRQWNGVPYHPQSWKNKWNRFIAEHGLEHIRFHDLRHSNVTALIESGVNMKIVQYRAGHSNISTTMDIYAHCTTKMQQDAGERMDELFFND